MKTGDSVKDEPFSSVEILPGTKAFGGIPDYVAKI